VPLKTAPIKPANWQISNEKIIFKILLLIKLPPVIKLNCTFFKFFFQFFSAAKIYRLILATKIHKGTRRKEKTKIILIKSFWKSRNLFSKRFLAAGGKGKESGGKRKVGTAHHDASLALRRMKIMLLLLQSIVDASRLDLSSPARAIHPRV
jgi:hypothetical protein